MISGVEQYRQFCNVFKVVVVLESCIISGLFQYICCFFPEESRPLRLGWCPVTVPMAITDVSC